MIDKRTALGFVCGALIGWAVTADHAEKKRKEAAVHADNLEFRLEILRENYGKLIYAHEDLAKQHLEAVEALEAFGVTRVEDEQEGKEADEEDEDEPDIPVNETPEQTRVNLQNIIAQYTTDEDPLLIERGVEMEHDPSPPFVISQKTFAGWGDEDGADYDKLTYTYYPRHRILLDEDEEVIDDVANTVGWKNLNRFGDESEDPDTVFIRNQRLKLDLEVVRNEETDLPAHVKYGMDKEEYKTQRAAGLIRFDPEDQ